MKFLHQILDKIARSCTFRADWGLLGVYYLQSSSFKPQSIKIANRRVILRSPDSENPRETINALGKILVQDEYGLKRFRNQKPRTILDVGGNVGLFSIVARTRFPKAEIHCYEPSPNLSSILHENLEELNIHLHEEGLGSHHQSVRMVDRGPSSVSTTQPDENGATSVIPLKDAVKRLGGSVDLLKLDCEGAEWAIFKDTEGWKNIKNVTMEYHLWAGRPQPLRPYRMHTLTRFSYHSTGRKSDQLQRNSLGD